jgi:transposase
VTRLLPSPDQVIIEVRPRPTTAQCPTCGLASHKIHSVYRRVLADLPWQGRPVSIRVAARRSRCPNRICSRQTFAERLGGVMELSSRRTGRLSDLQRHLVLALGGEAGSRLASRLAIPTSPDTLLRLALTRSCDRPDLSPAVPRALGVDDWAWRRGRHYGTMLVNLETNEVVDLLPDREATTRATWRRQTLPVAFKAIAFRRASWLEPGSRAGADGGSVGHAETHRLAAIEGPSHNCSPACALICALALCRFTFCSRHSRISLPSKNSINTVLP